MDLVEGQEAMTVAAVFDERRLQARFDPCHLGEIDVPAKLFAMFWLSKSNSSTRFPSTTTTRVSSGWAASIKHFLGHRKRLPGAQRARGPVAGMM
jgi:hypothetical protein